MSRICGDGRSVSGSVGKWRWERVPTSYPALVWGGNLDKENRYGAWTGAIRLTHPDGTAFLLFSYLSNRDTFCEQYLASTDDLKILRRFKKDVTRHFTPRIRGRIEIHVVNGPNIEIPSVPSTSESMVLPDGMLEDIDAQVAAFFTGRGLFQRLGARYQRGFLFVGPPGTGKTLTMRRIVRTAHAEHRARAVSVNITRNMDEDDLGTAFRRAEMRAPSVLILDDMDSITTESAVSRSMLLSLLDGLKAGDNGVLVVGASNHPGDIDPALVHRPSRFDRVWTFPLPDKALRLRYLTDRFSDIAADVLEDVARRTGNWSYAYLNELRTSAAILANAAKQETVTKELLTKAVDMLGTQFESGRKNHACAKGEEAMGFGMP
jgi:DNA polymerase III delta prime subunit